MDSDDEYGDFPSCTQLEIMTSNASFDKVNQVFPPQETKIVSQAMCLQADLPSEELDGRKSQRLACSPEKHRAGGGFRLDCKASPSEPRPPSCALTSQILTQNHNEISQIDTFSATEKNTPTKMLRIPQSIFSNSLKALEGSQSKKSMQNDLSILPQKILAKEKDQLSSNRQQCHETHFQGISHHDTLFSPAQDICDLISNLDADDFLSNSQILNEINPNGSVSTPDSIQAGLCSSKPEFPTPVSRSNLAIDFKPNLNFDIAAESPSYKTQSWNMGHGQNENFDDLICTQDLINMSQEIREMTSPSYASEPKFNVQKPKEKTRERKRFFEEKEEDLLEAALYESKMMNIASTNIRQNDELVPIKNVLRSSSLFIAPPISDKTDEKFPSERSKKLPTQKQKPLSTVARQYSHPSVSHGGSSPSISSFSWGIEESHLDSSPSTATDYGMDELSGDDWNELSAFC